MSERYKDIKDGGPTTGARELAQEAHEEKAAQLPRAPKAAPILCCFHKLSLQKKYLSKTLVSSKRERNEGFALMYSV